MNNRILIIILAITGLHFVLSLQFAKHFSKPPLITPIDIKHSEANWFDISIPMEQTYQVNLRFYREEQPYWYLNQVFGNIEKYQQPGIPLMVGWQIKSNQQVVASSQMISNNACEWKHAYVTQCFDEFKLPKGDYQFGITFLEPAEQHKAFKTTLAINYTLLTADTWQTEYIFWSMLFNYFVAPFFVGLIAIVLAWRFILFNSLRFYRWRFPKQPKYQFKEKRERNTDS